MDEYTDNKKVKSSPFVEGNANAVGTINHSVDGRTFSESDSHNVTTNDSHNVTTNDSHNVTNVYYGKSLDEHSLGERKTLYHDFCKQLITNGVISKKIRIRLDEYAMKLSLDKDVTSEIENNIRSVSASTDTLSGIDQMTLDMVVSQIKKNDANIKDQLPKLEAISEKVDQDDVHFYYYLVLASENPSAYIKRYEERDCDSYWQTYWAFTAYKRNGAQKKAATVLASLDNWDESVDNVALLQCFDLLYDYFVRSGSRDVVDIVRKSLSNSVSVSYLLMPFKEAIAYLANHPTVPAVWSNSPECNFYLKLFEVKDRPAKPEIKPQSFNTSAATVQTTSHSARVSNEAIEQINRSFQQAQSSRPVQQTQPTQTRVTQSKPASSDNKKTIIIAVVAGIVLLFLLKGLFSGSSDNKSASPVAVVEETSVTVESSPKKSVAVAKPAQTATPAANTQPAEAKAQSQTSSQPSAAKAEPTQTAKAAEPQPSEMTAEECLSKGTKLLKKFEDGKALPYLQTAVEKGNYSAAKYLGDLYYNGGNDISKSYPKAFEYYSKAANAGIVDAQYMLGLMYRNGQGCTKDLSQAKTWLGKAADQGNEKAAKILNSL